MANESFVIGATEFERRQLAINAGKRISEFPEDEISQGVDNVVHYGLERTTPEARRRAAEKIVATLSKCIGEDYKVEIVPVVTDDEHELPGINGELPSH